MSRSSPRHAWLVVGVCLLVSGGLLGSPETAQGQGNIRLGPFRLSPSLEQSAEYNDNILLAPRGEKSDFILTTSPGLAVELAGRRAAFRLGYRADILRYLREDTLDAVHHTVDADARLDFAGGLSLFASDEFRRTTDFAGFPVPELLERIPRHENVLKAGAEYSLRRISAAFDYRFFLVDFRDEPVFDELDRKEHLFGLTGFYRVLPKTSVLAEYNYQIVRYDLDPIAAERDSHSNKFKVGLKGDLTAKTTVVLKVGYELKDFDSRARKDFNGPIAEAEAFYKYREPSQVRLFFGRVPFESTFAGVNVFVATFGGLEILHHFTPKLRARLAGLVGVDDYQEAATVGGETKRRSDRFYEVGVSLRYQIQRWLAAELGYSYALRDSNFADFDYGNNRVRASVGLAF